MKRLNGIFDRFLDSLAFIAGSFVVCMVLVESYEVIARYFLKRPPLWGTETIEYMLFLIAFLGAAWLLKERGHIAVNLLTERLKPRTQIYFAVLASAIGTVISLIIVWYGFKTTWECYVTGAKIVSVSSPPKYIFLVFVPFGYLLLAVQFIRQFWGDIRRLGSKEKRKEES